MKARDFEKEFEEKYNSYGSMLYKIAFLYLNSASDAEDVLQEVFSKYLLTRKDFNNKEHEKAWFIRTTQNYCLDTLRKSERKNLDIDDLSVITQPDNDTKQDIERSIIALPPKYKIVIFLHYYSGYSVEEISRILKIGKSAVKKRLQRGREMLKLRLEDYEN